MASLLLFFILLPPNVQAAQYGLVSAAKAVIYADVQMQAPIGFLKRGKKVLVGEVSRGIGQVLPIVVSGKLAYIQKEDLYLEKDQGLENKERKKFFERKISEHKLDYKEKVKDFIFFNINFGGFSINESAYLIETSTEESQSEGELITGGSGSNIKLMVEYRSPSQWLGWNLSFSRFSHSVDSDYEFETYTGELNGVAHVVRTPIISGGPFFGMVFSADAKEKLSGGQFQSDGTMYGLQYGLQANILPYAKIGAVLTYSVYNFKFSNMSPITFEDPFGISSYSQTLQKHSGSYISFGLSYKFD